MHARTETVLDASVAGRLKGFDIRQVLGAPSRALVLEKSSPSDDRDLHSRDVHQERVCTSFVEANAVDRGENLDEQRLALHSIAVVLLCEETLRRPMHVERSIETMQRFPYPSSVLGVAWTNTSISSVSRP